MDTPCPYKIEFLKQSPFCKEGRSESDMIKLVKDQEKIYLSGMKISFTYVSSLKSMVVYQGSCTKGRVPRVDGKYKLGRKYFDLL